MSMRLVAPASRRIFIPQIGLFLAQIFLLLGLPGFLIMSMVWGYGKRHYGLYVLTQLYPIMKSRSCGESWVVRIDEKENWFLNSIKTSPQELAPLLRQQLGNNTNCAVYLDVDPSVNYAIAVLAIASIEATPAKTVVLLPAKARIPSTR